MGSAVAQGRGEVVVGDIRGIINPVMAGYVTRVLDDAERTNAAAVVFTMDTPGGLVDSMREINQRILAAKVPVLVYVAPNGARAGSAGVYITYAAHLAAMAPTTNIGSATPVSVGDNGGEQQLSPEMRSKLTNDAVAQIRALAEQRGRNAEFAEQAVREATNLQASEALRQGVVNYVATDVPDLLRQADGARVRTATGDVVLRTADAPVRSADMSGLERLLLAITNPTIAYILLSVGSLGLIIELYNPGSIFPGVIGGISLLLAFYALGTLPVSYAGLGLLLFGLALFALEPFVVSHGILGVGGLLAFVAGSLLLVQAPDSAPFLQVAPAAIAAMTAVMALFFFVILGAILSARRKRVVTGREGLLGAHGTVLRSAITPGVEGLVRVQGELWSARSEARPLAVGADVVVVSMEGLRLTVRDAPVVAAAAAPVTAPVAEPHRV
ncbi:MAG: nodulation protein NfeD [Chloroflexi bacterium]|nr:nodulation protein NfeD [Chloroflexota bacterium]